MGLDDDEDCSGHDWQLAEVVVDLAGARQVFRCSRCPAVSYEPSAQD